MGFLAAQYFQGRGVVSISEKSKDTVQIKGGCGGGGKIQISHTLNFSGYIYQVTEL